MTRHPDQASVNASGETGMTEMSRSLRLSRRDLLKAGGLSAVAIGAAGLAPQFIGRFVQPAGARGADGIPDLHWAGTDGWIHLPPTPAIPPYHPDPLAPDPMFTTYMFGFRNVTGMTDPQVINQRMKAQHSAPLFWVDQYDPNAPKDFLVKLSNIGLALRPDLFDSHTIHWHGFKNVIAYFDGEPTGSVSVPPGQSFTYVYRPHDPGTYMYHCHVEDVEHVHMGMTSLVFVRPLQNGNTTLYASGKYAYNDGDGSTGYDREFALFLSEVWAEAHWADAHIQLPEWSDYRADFAMLNGRVYPDTIAPNAPTDWSNEGSANSIPVAYDVNGDLVPPDGHPELQYQPLSALITCMPGERVLIRMSNLGFKEAAMTMQGMKVRVIGRDATLMRGRDGTDTSYLTNTMTIGAGESYDAIFTAPAFSGGNGTSGHGYDRYVFFNRNLTRANNLAPGGEGGQRTEVRVYPSGLAAQQYPNDWGM
jgi:FtsP/CotA-like multicopper oxidase with cupredoxin domain